MIPYARQTIEDADVAAVVEVLRSDFLTQGPVVPRFEHAVSAYCGARHAVAVCNATSALHIAASALGLRPGGLLWTSPISFVASANCGLYCGADVDFVDIDPQTYNISVSALSVKLQEGQKRGRVPDAVVVVDFAGQPSDLAEIAELRDRYGFRVIEDASHAIGAAYDNERVGHGRYADITVFSFHPVKIITTAEGGMALTNDEVLFERMHLLRGHGITRDRHLMTQPNPQPWEYEQLALGFNYRLTEVQAALGLAQMQRIEEFVSRRQAVAARYDRELATLPLITPFVRAGMSSAYHLYPVQVMDSAPIGRAELYGRLRERGVAPNVHYQPIYMQPYYRNLGFGPGYCANAERYYARALSLPMYAGITDEDQTRVIEALCDSIRA